MAFKVRFDKTLDTQGGANFDGTPGNFYAEEFLPGPASSRKFERIIEGTTGDEDISIFNNLSDITDVSEGFDFRMTASGIEASKVVFDGLKKGELHKVTFDYNLPDGWIFNSIVDEVSYRTVDEPETWLGMTFIDVFEHLLDARSDGKTATSGSNIVFNVGDWNTATGGTESFAGQFSFRNVPLPQAIDQVVQKFGNLIWFVEKNGENWNLKFKKRDLEQTDPKLAKLNLSDAGGIDTDLNVVGLNIGGPSTLEADAVRIIDEGRGFKFQVGGPDWMKGANGGTFNTEPPIEFRVSFDVQGNVFPSMDFMKSIQGAVARAATNAGFDSKPNHHDNYGWSNVSVLIENFASAATVLGDRKAGMHYLPVPLKFTDGKPDINTPLEIELHIPITPDDTLNSITKWKGGMSFPDKPDKQDGSGPVEDPWRIDTNLLTHPDMPFAIEVEYSEPPRVIDIRRDFLKDTEQEEIDKYKATWKSQIDLWKAEPGTYAAAQLAVADGYTEEFEWIENEVTKVAVAVIIFFSPSITSIGNDQITVDTLSGKLILKTSFTNRTFGDWSFAGRGGGENIPTGILTWTLDSNLFAGANASCPQPIIFIPLSKAFSLDSEFRFYFHGTLTTRMPQIVLPAGTTPGSATFETHQEDFQKHNLVFNAAGIEGHPDPLKRDGTDADPRDDTDRMTQRAQVVLDQVDPLKNVKGQFIIFPGDNTNVTLGTFTNGGIIAKIRHDYAPYFRTTFWLESSDHIRELVEPEPRKIIGELKTIVAVQRDKVAALEQTTQDVRNAIAEKAESTFDSAGAGFKGSDIGFIASHLLVRSTIEYNCTNVTDDNRPDIKAQGLGKEGEIDLSWDKQGGKFFSGGMVVDGDPQLDTDSKPFFKRPKNISSPIVKPLNRETPADEQQIGYTHNYLDLTKTSEIDGFEGKDRWRVVLNIREDPNDGILNSKLDNFGGDRLNLGDMYFRDNLGGTTLGRKGELTSYITNNMFFTRRVDGIALTDNYVMLGVSKESKIAGTDQFEFQNGATLGINKTVGTTKNYEYVLNMDLEDTDAHDFARQIISGPTKRLGIYLGPSIGNIDPQFSKNNQYFLRIDSGVPGAVGGGPITGPDPLGVAHTYNYRTVANPVGDAAFHRSEKTIGVLTGLWFVAVDNFQTGNDYTPLISREFPRTHTADKGTIDKITMRHELVQSTDITIKVPSWTISHGRNGLKSPDPEAFVRLSEGSIGALTGTGGPNAPVNIKSPKFSVSAIGLLDILGDEKKELFVYQSGSGSFYCGETTNKDGDEKSIFRVNTDGTWRSLFASVSAQLVDSDGLLGPDSATTDEADLLAQAGEGDNIVKFLDTNDEFIIGFRNALGLISLLNIKPHPTGDQDIPAHANRYLGVFTPDLEWRAVGIDVSIGGSFATATTKLLEKDTFQNVGFALVDAHNLLVDKLADIELRYACLVGAIFGPEGESLVGLPIAFDRHLKLMSGLAGGGQANRNFIIESDDTNLHIGLDVDGISGKDNGLFISAGTTSIGQLYTDTLTVGSDINKATVARSVYTDKRWQAGMEDGFGFLATNDTVPSGTSSSATKPVIFKIECEVENSDSSSTITIRYLDIVDKIIEEIECVVTHPPLDSSTGGGLLNSDLTIECDEASDKTGTTITITLLDDGKEVDKATCFIPCCDGTNPPSITIPPTEPKTPGGGTRVSPPGGIRRTGPGGGVIQGPITPGGGVRSDTGGTFKVRAPLTIDRRIPVKTDQGEVIPAGDGIIRDASNGTIRVFTDSDGFQEVLSTTQIQGSYIKNDDNTFSTNIDSDKASITIVNNTVSTTIVGVPDGLIRLDDVATALTTVSGPRGTIIAAAQGLPTVIETRGIVHGREPIDLNVNLLDNKTNDVGTIMNKIRSANPIVTRPALDEVIKLGGADGIVDVAVDVVTGQGDAPIIDPRAGGFDSSLFIRSTFRWAGNAMTLGTDAVGRWVFRAGNNIIPTQTNTFGTIEFNTNRQARMAFTGVQGATMAFLEDAMGIELFPGETVSRRAFGIAGRVTRVSDAGGGITTQDIIMNNYGIHGAQIGDDGENDFGNIFRYDDAVTQIIWGGEIGLLRRQINRTDGLVATGNSGLWIGGLTLVLEGDSIEEAVTKIDDRAARTGGVEQSGFTPIQIDHNFGKYPQATALIIVDGIPQNALVYVAHDNLSSPNHTQFWWNTSHSVTASVDTSQAGPFQL